MNNNLINSSFKYCEEITRKHYENFPVASFFIPHEKRKYIHAIYAFARAADDFADEPGIEGGIYKRLALLDEWEKKLDDCLNDKTYDPIFIALNKTLKDCNLPVEPLRNLLKAFKEDVTVHRYKSFDEVLGYCQYSANPVGRLVLMIFGEKNEEWFKLSDKICTALQLTNFLQDVAIDLEKDRIYLPEDDMLRFGYNEQKLLAREYDNCFIELMKFEVARTYKLFDEGKELIGIIKDYGSSKRLYHELRLTWLGGREILKKIKTVNYNIFGKRLKLKKTDFIKLFFQTV
jgi:squalene synthase HpnC